MPSLSQAPAVGIAMRTFIRATEIWVPTKDRKGLELGTGLYGPLAALEAVSQGTQFGFGEGLPGRAWEAGHPIILKELANSYFKRGEAAAAAGLTCAVAVPVFAGPFLMAVIVLLCGDDREHVGAIELWHTPADSSEMGLVDGYYGTADVFEWSSRHTKFMRGTGLPGLVWQSGMPVILEDLGRSKQFLRWESAQKVGISRGIGIPCGREEGETWVLTFLSALGTPIAQRFETWAPSVGSGGLSFKSGYCERVSDLQALYYGLTLSGGEGTLGHVWRSGVPAICTDLSSEPQIIREAAHAAGLTTMVALPIISDGALKSIVAWYL